MFNNLQVYVLLRKIGVGVWKLQRFILQLCTIVDYS